MLSNFQPQQFQHARGWTSMSKADAAAAPDLSGWDSMKAIVNPMVWAWYDAHKDQKVTTLFKFYTVTVGSFGITEMVLTAIFGARQVPLSQQWGQLP